MHFVDVGNQYNTIAIIGPQSSGKSTLLNKLFDTNFEVMNSSVRRGQTTKGVWMAGEKNQKVLIIDCEIRLYGNRFFFVGKILEGIAKLQERG